eukprot:COSAG04_NODE_29202_length_270_cov_0.912281_1_plen_59_part_10
MASTGRLTGSRGNQGMAFSEGRLEQLPNGCKFSMHGYKPVARFGRLLHPGASLSKMQRQ